MDPKPKILAFHGSGSNSMIHTVQLARLTRVIGSEFEIESLSAPFPSQAGPGVLPFFDGCGPYKRWLPAPDTVAELKDGPHISTMPSEVEELVRSTVKRIRDSGGEVAGLIGFSQGTRVVTGLLKCAEIIAALKKNDENVDELDWCDWSFGITVCGSAPPPFIAQSVSAALNASKLSEDEKKELLESKIAIPTYHILGNQDEFKGVGKLLIEQCYEVAEGKSAVKEVDIGHFYPIQSAENEQLGKWTIEVFKKEKA